MTKDHLKIKEIDDGIFLECYVTPRAKKSTIKGVRDGALAIALAAPPVDGKANRELIEFLAETLSIPKSSISIIRGEHGRKKHLFIKGARLSNLTATFANHDS